MEHKEDRIIEEIKGTLINYELPYEEGAWENFNKRQKVILFEKKMISRNGLWRLTATAAAVLLFLLGGILFNQESVNDKNLTIVNTVNDDTTERGNEEGVFNPNTQNEQAEGFTEKDNYVPLNIMHSNQSKSISENVTPDPGTNVSLITSNTKKSADMSESTYSDETTNRERSSIINKPHSEEQTILSHIENQHRDLGKEDKWKFGVELSSSFIADNVNFGAGLITELKLSNKFSLATGVAYTKIDASNAIDPVGISATTQKVGVEASMQALDIPLSVVYQVNDGLYASVGVSALAVLNENKAYQYETQLISESFVTDPETGSQLTEYSVTKKEYSESADETSLKGSNNIGYLNISIGKKQSFYGQTQLLFEPFLKVPLGQLSNEDIRLTNGGLKIKLMF